MLSRLYSVWKWEKSPVVLNEIIDAELGQQVYQVSAHKKPIRLSFGSLRIWSARRSELGDGIAEISFALWRLTVSSPRTNLHTV